MHKLLFLLSVLLVLVSCKIQPGSSRHNADGNPDKVYKLRLNPAHNEEHKTLKAQQERLDRVEDLLKSL
jgi:hypothetical protein